MDGTELEFKLLATMGIPGHFQQQQTELGLHLLGYNTARNGDQGPQGLTRLKSKPWFEFM